MATVYEVIEFNPQTGEFEGVFLTSALGPVEYMSSAEVIGHWPQIRELGGHAFVIQVESGYGLAA